MAKPPRGPAFLVHMDGIHKAKACQNSSARRRHNSEQTASRRAVPVQTERRFRRWEHMRVAFEHVSNAKWRPRRLTFTMVQSAPLSRARATKSYFPAAATAVPRLPGQLVPNFLACLAGTRRRSPAGGSGSAPRSHAPAPTDLTSTLKAAIYLLYTPGPTRGRIDPFLPHQHHTPSSSQSTRVRPVLRHFLPPTKEPAVSLRAHWHGREASPTTTLPPRRHGTRHTRKAQADELLPQILSSMLRRNRGCEFGFQFRRAPMELRF
nr:unnamed protein product [Digitaria exilis]